MSIESAQLDRFRNRQISLAARLSYQSKEAKTYCLYIAYYQIDPSQIKSTQFPSPRNQAAKKIDAAMVEKYSVNRP
jgi:hypothetical protein